MANTLAPFGFRMLGNWGGASPSFDLVQRKIASADTQAIYHNDPVKSLDTGYVAAFTAGTAVSQLAGIFVGCRYISSATGEYVFSQYWPGGGNTGDGIALIAPANLAVPPRFVVQSLSTAITLANIGENIDVSMGTGSAYTKLSGATINPGTLGTTATLPFRIMGLYDGVGNGSDAASSYNWVIVAANVAGAGSTGTA